MRDFEIRCRFAACIFLIASCLIATGASGAEPETFRHLLTLPLDYDPQAKRPLYGEGCPLGVAFSSDGKTLAAAWFNEKSVVLFDLPSGQVSATINNQPYHSFAGVAFSSDGKVLACGGRGVMLWDVANGRRLSSRLPTSSNLKEEWLRGVSIAPNCRLVAVQTLSIEDATEFKEVYQVWDLATGQSIGKFDPFAGTEPTIDKGLYDKDVDAVAFSPDGKTLAVSIYFVDDELPEIDHTQIWDLSSRKLMTSFEGNSCCFTPDGETLVYGLRGKGEGSPGKIEFRSAKTLKVQPTLEAEAVIVTAHHPMLALSGDGKVLATSNQDHAVQLWNLPARKLIAVLKGHERAIASIAFSADGTRVATSSYDGSIRLWALIPR